MRLGIGRRGAVLRFGGEPGILQFECDYLRTTRAEADAECVKDLVGCPTGE